MEYISAEEFLKQPKEVQEVFLKWWQPSEGDLFIFDVNKLDFKECVLFVMDDYIRGINALYNPNECIPMLAEGQLRKFIEDKTNRLVEPYLNVYKQYNFMLVNRKNEEFVLYESRKEDLLQAYWKVAVQIASKENTHE